MQNREPNTFEIWSGNGFGGRRPQQPAGLWNFFKPDRDDVLVVRESSRDRARAALLVVAAVAASFGLGWAGGLNWPRFASELGLVEVAQKETPSPRISEARPAGRIEGARKTASASDAPAIVGSIPRPPALLPGGTRPSAGPVSQAIAVPPVAAISLRQPLVAAPETKPATIPGFGRSSMFGTVPPFSKVPMEFAWPHAATPFPASDAWSPSCAGAAAGSLPPPAD